MAVRPRIIVVGGGIGGLAAARALLRRDFDVRVYESAPELREIGAGVALGPNAMKALRALDLEDAVREIAFQSEYQMLRSWRSGRVISKTSRAGAVQRYGAAGCSAHRADLLDVLAAAVPTEAVTLGARCVSAGSDANGAHARFADGTEVEGDIVLGADGIHSVVRASLFGPDAPRFTGKICYRSVIPTDAVEGGGDPTNATWLGPHGAVVVYGVRRGELINVVAHYEDPTYQHESWITECDRAEVLERYRGWNDELARLFSASEVWYKWALYDRDPMPVWTRGRASLLGDSAHSMLPYLGQGACQAIEDGVILAAALDQGRENLPVALEHYEAIRRPRANRVVLAARARGDDNHLVSPIAAARRDVLIALRKRFGKDAESGRNDSWIPEYDAGSPSVLNA
jgi:salicylate hydroxylase